MSIQGERRAIVDREHAYVLEQITHLRAKGRTFADWIVVFVVADPNDDEAMQVARAFGWKDGTNTDFLSGLTRRDELCAAMRARGVDGAGIIEQDVQPGKLRCVVFDRGMGIHDVDVPLSIGN